MVIEHSDGLPEKQICSSKLVPELLMQNINKYKVVVSFSVEFYKQGASDFVTIKLNYNKLN